MKTMNNGQMHIPNQYPHRAPSDFDIVRPYQQTAVPQFPYPYPVMLPPAELCSPNQSSTRQFVYQPQYQQYPVHRMGYFPFAPTFPYQYAPQQAPSAMPPTFISVQNPLPQAPPIVNAGPVPLPAAPPASIPPSEAYKPAAHERKPITIIDPKTGRPVIEEAGDKPAHPTPAAAVHRTSYNTNAPVFVPSVGFNGYMSDSAASAVGAQDEPYDTAGMVGSTGASGAASTVPTVGSDSSIGEQASGSVISSTSASSQVAAAAAGQLQPDVRASPAPEQLVSTTNTNARVRISSTDLTPSGPVAAPSPVPPKDSSQRDAPAKDTKPANDIRITQLDMLRISSSLIPNKPPAAPKPSPAVAPSSDSSSSTKLEPPQLAEPEVPNIDVSQISATDQLLTPGAEKTTTGDERPESAAAAAGACGGSPDKDGAPEAAAEEAPSGAGGAVEDSVVRLAPERVPSPLAADQVGDVSAVADFDDEPLPDDAEADPDASAALAADAPEGRRKYDKASLRKMIPVQNLALVPQGINLPEANDCVLREARINVNSSKAKTNLTPSFYQTQRGGPQHSGYTHGRYPPPPKQRPSLIPTAVLPEEQHRQQMERKARAILNKLTPENFSTLMEDLMSKVFLQLMNENELKSVVKVTFEKVCAEAHYSSMFAVMLTQLKKRLDEKEKEKEKLAPPTSNFQLTWNQFFRPVMQYCHDYFYDDQEEQRYREKEAECHKLTQQNPDQYNSMVQDLEDMRLRMKTRSKGNVSFVSELYNRGIIKKKVIYEVMDALLVRKSDVSIESLRDLLSRVADRLNKDLSNDRLRESVDKVRKLVRDPETPIRHRLLLQDVLDLKENEWRPRKEADGPKVLQDAHKVLSEREKLLQTVPSGGGGGAQGGYERKPQYKGTNSYSGMQSRGVPINQRLQGALDSSQPNQNPYNLGFSRPAPNPTSSDSQTFFKPDFGSNKFGPPSNKTPALPAEPESRPTCQAPTKRQGESSAPRATPDLFKASQVLPSSHHGSRAASLTRPEADGVSAAGAAAPSTGRDAVASGASSRRDSAAAVATEPPAAAHAAASVPRPSPLIAPPPVNVATPPNTFGLSHSVTSPGSLATIDQHVDYKSLSEEKRLSQVEAFLRQIDHSDSQCEEDWPSLRYYDVDNQQKFLIDVLEKLMDRNTQTRLMVSRRIFSMYKVWQARSLVDGSAEFVEHSNDLVDDVPQLFQYLGEILYPLAVEHSVVSFTHFLVRLEEAVCRSVGAEQQAVPADKVNARCGAVLRSLLSTASSNYAHKSVSFGDALFKRLNDGNVVVLRPFYAATLQEFCPRFKSLLALQQPHQQLVQWLALSDRTLELFNAVCHVCGARQLDKLDQYLQQPSDGSELAFFRSCYGAIFVSSFDAANQRIEPLLDTLNQLNPSLPVPQNDQAEYSILFAAQVVAHYFKHPPGLLAKLLHMLTTGTICSRESILEWYDCGATCKIDQRAISDHYQLGRAEALAELQELLTRLQRDNADQPA